MRERPSLPPLSSPFRSPEADGEGRLIGLLSLAETWRAHYLA